MFTSLNRYKTKNCTKIVCYFYRFYRFSKLLFLHCRFYQYFVIFFKFVSSVFSFFASSFKNKNNLVISLGLQKIPNRQPVKTVTDSSKNLCFFTNETGYQLNRLTILETLIVGKLETFPKAFSLQCKLLEYQTY